MTMKDIKEGEEEETCEWKIEKGKNKSVQHLTMSLSPLIVQQIYFVILKLKISI
jgi:hypothetical protein